MASVTAEKVLNPPGDVHSDETGTDSSHPIADEPVEADASLDEKPKFERGPRFWAIIATLCVIGLLSALENTVVTTSLPYIITELNLGENYIWVTNVFFLTR